MADPVFEHPRLVDLGHVRDVDEGGSSLRFMVRRRGELHVMEPGEHRMVAPGRAPGVLLAAALRIRCAGGPVARTHGNGVALDARRRERGS